MKLLDFCGSYSQGGISNLGRDFERNFPPDCILEVLLDGILDYSDWPCSWLLWMHHLMPCTCLTHGPHHKCCIPQFAWLGMEKGALHAAVEGAYSKFVWGSLISWLRACFELTEHLEKWAHEGFSLWVCRLDHGGWLDHWLPYFQSALWLLLESSI